MNNFLYNLPLTEKSAKIPKVNSSSSLYSNRFPHPINFGNKSFPITSSQKHGITLNLLSNFMHPPPITVPPQVCTEDIIILSDKSDRYNNNETQNINDSENENENVNVNVNENTPIDKNNNFQVISNCVKLQTKNIIFDGKNNMNKKTNKKMNKNMKMNTNININIPTLTKSTPTDLNSPSPPKSSPPDIYYDSDKKKSHRLSDPNNILTLNNNKSYDNDENSLSPPRSKFMNINRGKNIYYIT